MKLSILSDIVERAARLDPTGPESALRAAFQRGLQVLDNAAASGLAAAPDPVLDQPRFDVLRERALVLTQRQQRLEQAVEELAAESLTLQDSLWSGHERSSRMKVRLGRRRGVTVRPEPPLSIGGSGRRRAERAGRLLAGLTLVEIELELPPDAGERAAVLAERRGWSDERFEDAVQVVLAHGLAALELERRSPNGGAADDRSTAPALEALAHRVFELSESLRILQIRENAFRIDNHGMRLRLAQLEQEIGALEEEVKIVGPGASDDGSGPGRLLGRFLRRKG